MNVGVIQVDGKLPNLALMQIAAYHLRCGDSVRWFDGTCDAVYASKLFSFSKAKLPDGCMLGGTGVDFINRLPAEIAATDPADGWFLYPKCTWHQGFSQRGCRFRCEFCCVPQKEGRPWATSGIGGLLTNPNGEDRLMLLDNDFFGGPNWRENLIDIQRLDLQVCFCQGLNIRIITDEQARMLAATRFCNAQFSYKQVTFAWDRWQDRRLIESGIDRCVAAGIKTWQMQFFVLVGFNTTPEQDLERVEYLKGHGCDPFAMPYNKFDPYQKAFCRWVNHRAVFNSVAWRDYRYAGWPLSKDEQISWLVAPAPAKETRDGEI